MVCRGYRIEPGFDKPGRTVPVGCGDKVRRLGADLLRQDIDGELPGAHVERQGDALDVLAVWIARTAFTRSLCA